MVAQEGRLACTPGPEKEEAMLIRDFEVST
jgi:hypothetical protein